MKFVEKCGEPLYKFLSILMEIFCTIFMSVFGKTSEELWEKYAIIRINIDIDTREKYQYLSISIGTFPITTLFALELFFCFARKNVECNNRTTTVMKFHMKLGKPVQGWIKNYSDWFLRECRMKPVEHASTLCCSLVCLRHIPQISSL